MKLEFRHSFLTSINNFSMIASNSKYKDLVVPNFRYYALK